MKRLIPIILLFVLFFGGCATVPRVRAPSVDEVVLMSKNSDPPELIIARMRDSGAVYRLPASELAKLREQGVNDRVIDYMQQTWIEEARREEALRQWHYRRPWGWPPYWYGPYHYYPHHPYW